MKYLSSLAQGFKVRDISYDVTIKNVNFRQKTYPVEELEIDLIGLHFTSLTLKPCAKLDRYFIMSNLIKYNGGLRGNFSFFVRSN